MVSSCNMCLKHHAEQAKKPMIVSDLPDKTLQIVGTDLFHYKGRDYLLVIDYLSNCPQLALLFPQMVNRANGPYYS